MSDRLAEFYATIDTHGLATAALACCAGGGADPLLGSFLRSLIFVLRIAIVIVGALDRVGMPTASLLAALGAAGLAIGPALQGSLSNLAAGLLLMVLRPFRLGQWAEAGGVAATVQRVS